MYFCSVVKYALKIFRIPIPSEMSAYVVRNPGFTDAPLSVANEGPETDFKSYPPKPWFKKKRLILGSVIIGIVLAVGIVLLVHFLAKDSSSKSMLPQFNEMESDIKKSANPCNNFYEYSCGRYIDRYLPDRLTSSFIYRDKFATLMAENTKKAHGVIEGMGSTKDPFFKKAYTYYKACMNSARNMNAYFRAVDEIGGSDITTIGSFDYANWNLETALTKMKVQYNANPLFIIHVGHDLFNTSRNILLIYAPDSALISKLASEDSEFPSMQGRREEIVDYDLDTVASLVKSFKSRLGSKFATDASRRTSKSFFSTDIKVLEATEFEAKLLEDIKATSAGLKLRDVYKIVTVEKLNNITGYRIRWSSLLQSLSPKGTSFKINNDTEIGLMVPLSYLDKLKTYVSSFYRRRLPNYFAWLLLKKFSPVLPDDYFAQYYFNAPATDMGKKGKEKWRACLLETETTIPFSVGMMFTKDIITQLKVNKLSEMLLEVRSAFRNGSKQLTWLDQATKDAVEDKIKSVLQVISGPDLFKTGFLANLYKDLTISGKTYPQIFESAQRTVVQINLKHYFQPAKRDEFDFGGHVMKLYDVNALYVPARNLIMILSGIMRSPFVYENGQSYINFAKIGAILGHELLHGFDSNGWNYDKLGQISPWTTKHSQDGFKVRANCVRNQYSAYKSGSNYINGSKTLPENIADNAGLKYAYLAYKSYATRRHLNESKPTGLEDLSYDQLFFVGYAQMWCRAASTAVKDFIANTDTHSPNEYRVVGSVSNFKPFADAFKCGRGTPMSPIRRCEFW